MSTPPPVWQPTPQPWASAPVPAGPGPLAAWAARGGAVLLTALWGLVATVVAGLFLAPLVAQSLDPRVPLGPVQLVGLSVLLASPARLAAGAAGAALLSLCGVTSSRLRAVPVAATGALGSWLLHLAIITPAAGSLERALQDDRLLWELPRWVVEAAVGALLVPAGRAPRSAWGDRGAATVEHAGVLTVAVTLVLALVLAATGIGQRIAQQVCRALQISCGAVEDRAVTLGVPCVLLKTERSGSADAVFAVVRVSGENGDELVVNGDGSASVKIYQGNGVGAGVAPVKLRVGPKKTGADVGAEAYAEVYGQGAYVYEFPESAGGVEAALAFLDSRRGVVGQVGDAVVPTMPWIREQYTHAEHDLSTFGDAVSTTLGLGPTAAERAAEEAAFQAQTAESLELTLGARGAAEGNLEVLGSGGTAGITGDLHGTVSIPQHGGPGAVTSTFTFAESGTVAASLSASPTVGGGPGPASWGAGGSAGGGVEFAVEYDGAGQPTTLTMTTQTRHESASGVTVKTPAVGKPSKGSTTKPAEPAKPGGTSAQDESPELHGNEATGTLTVTTQTLDLALPENRAAFDRVFASTTGEVDGHRYGASALRPTALLDGGALARRFALDGYDTRSEYAERSGAVGPDGKDRGADVGLGAKAADVGLEGELSSTTTELISAVAQDHRTGGGVHPLVTCG